MLSEREIGQTRSKKTTWHLDLHVCIYEFCLSAISFSCLFRKCLVVACKSYVFQRSFRLSVDDGPPIRLGSRKESWTLFTLQSAQENLGLELDFPNWEPPTESICLFESICKLIWFVSKLEDRNILPAACTCSLRKDAWLIRACFGEVLFLQNVRFWSWSINTTKTTSAHI